MAVIHRLTPAPDVLGWTFGDRLRKVRRVHRLTQKQLAVAIGATPSAVDAWESDRNLPRKLIEEATHIEDVFGLPRGWMLGYADHEAAPSRVLSDSTYTPQYPTGDGLAKVYRFPEPRRVDVSRSAGISFR